MKKKKRVFDIAKEPEFIVLNDQCQAFIGFKQGEAIFSDDLDLAKPLYNDNQVATLRVYTYGKLEKEYI
jgi:hypothetical protein